MDLLGSLVIAFSMYSRIPMPRLEWSGKRMKYALCFFPMIGVVMGIFLWGFECVVEMCSLGLPVRWVGGVVLPLLVTGGIHMDGFLDVADARASYGEHEKKLEILKDPHIGAFAAIKGGIYLLLYLAVFSEMPEKKAPVMGAVYVMTRAMSGLSVVAFPKAKKEGLAASFSEKARKRAVMAAMALYFLACLIFLWIYGTIFLAGGMAMAAVFLFLWYYRIAVREFGGMTGDLAGWFLQNAELGLMTAAVIIFKVFR